jgi:hypothetical protein
VFVHHQIANRLVYNQLEFHLVSLAVAMSSWQTNGQRPGRKLRLVLKELKKKKITISKKSSIRTAFIG